MHLYIFGSLCRGEVDFNSDVDLLAITENFDARFDPEVFSIYSYKRIDELWKEGNPFAWHLATEARLIFSIDGRNHINELGQPEPYHRCAEDCIKFAHLYAKAVEALKGRNCSRVFELSIIFLAIRNFATCFSLGKTRSANFSRHSAKNLGELSINISERCYTLLEQSRILSTRAVGHIIHKDELDDCFDEICGIASWMNKLLAIIRANGRV